ncbi:MAG TPA: glycosyltransferase family 9 protein [Nitrospiraceae bacterium]|nr:glycosyltransferase family 9 protein [Nitrospiraceae bacterium]
MRRTLLVIHPGALGDVLLSLPAIRGLRGQYPDHEIGIVAGWQVGNLLRACYEVEEVFSLESDALASLLVGPESVSPPLRGWLARCDLAVCWMIDPGHRLYSVLKKLGVPRVIQQSSLSSVCEAVHQTDRVMETVREVVSIGDYSWRLLIPDQVIAAGRARLTELGILEGQPVSAVHPGSGSRHKCCVPTLLARVVAWLQANDVCPLLVGGPADDDRVTSLYRACEKPPPVLQRADLLSVAGGLAHADLFIGHDSGLTHLAAALHLPTVALFGPTDPRRWAPRGSNVTILTGEDCRCLGWDAVRACLDRPCLQIPVERLIQACEWALRRQERVLCGIQDRTAACLVRSSKLC